MLKIQYRYRETVYHIAVLQTGAANDRMTVTVEGVERDDKAQKPQSLSVLFDIVPNSVSLLGVDRRETYSTCR